jgi:Universal stress protein UspA and related nucleotide-binding proteins
MPVLVAYDGKEHSKKALCYAIEHAVVYNRSLYILASVVSKDDVERENELANIKGFLDAAKKKAQEQGVDTRTLIEAGNPSEAILAIAERIKAGTIIVGHSEKGTLDRVVVGSVSEHLIRGAHCTVIVVQ